MPSNVYGSTSGNWSDTLDISSFDQKPYLRNTYFENTVEEHFQKKFH